jgi:hypothetical protein
MRLTITIDGAPHNIDSTDPETLGRWIVEILARAEPVTPATYIQVQAQPSYLPQRNGDPARTDWIANSQLNGDLLRVRSPRELVAALAAQLDRLEGESDRPPCSGEPGPCTGGPHPRRWTGPHLGYRP